MDPSLIAPPSKNLPEPATRQLPAAVPMRRMLGPGVILLGLSIGSGEFMLWPSLVSKWGLVIFWAAALGVAIQFVLNMEIERYTLATGESAVTGFFRLSRVFGPVFLVCGIVPWIWPGWATGSATLLTWEIDGAAGGGSSVAAYAIGGLVSCGLVLSIGPVVYRTVELVQVGLVSLIFVLAVTLAILVVRMDSLVALVEGTFNFGHIPDGILLGALAFAGAGGTANLAQSNYIKDKGYGMGHYIGRITSPLTGREERISEVGYVFDDRPENLARWCVWWRRANIEHGVSFFALCLLSLALFCSIIHALLGDTPIMGESMEFLSAEADTIEAKLGVSGRHLFVWIGIIVLLTTEVGILDAVTRVVVDLLVVMFLRGVERWTWIYFVVLWSLVGFGVIVLVAGWDKPMQLLVLSASLNAFVMFLYSGLLLWLGCTSFQRPVRPSRLRIAALLFSLSFFGYFSFLTLQSELPKLFG
ncbi:MAG: Nramp family divalent metal transporter [Planctomycetota bacterium]